MPIPVPRNHLVPLAGAVLLILAACSGEPTDPRDPDQRANTPLDCVVRSYPCSFADVPVDILERSLSLGEEANAMVGAGTSMAATAAWLEGQQDVVEVHSDAAAIRFRVEGGREIWIAQAAALGVANQSEAAAATAAVAPLPAPRPAYHVVAPAAEQKKALVLAPFRWQAPQFDESPAVGAILSATRGYQGGVSVVANSGPTTATVGIPAFQSWDQYQVVHLATHGAVICDDSGCFGMLTAGTEAALVPPGPGTTVEKLRTLAQVGLGYLVGQQPGAGEVVITADFFRHTYPGGLDNTVVFLNACESFGAGSTDIVDALRGNTSVVLGWDNPVQGSDAVAAALAIFEHLSDGGYTVHAAYEKLGSLRTGAAVPGYGAPQLRVSDRADGGDLRIRDVVTLLHPSSGATLLPTAKVSITGALNDGTADRAPYLVRVEGVPQDRAAGMMVTVTIDGVVGSPVPLTSGEIDDEDRWTISGDLLLGYDLQADRAVTYKARVGLYDEGESEHTVGATLTGSTEPIMGRTWRFEATQTTFWIGTPHTPYAATTTLTLEFATGQSPSDPLPRYVITGGTVTYDYNHTLEGCTYAADVLTYDVTDQHTGTSFLLFDTTADPITYRGVLNTKGPTFPVTESCSGGTPSIRNHTAFNTWMIINPNEARPVSGDMNTITGTYRVQNDFSNSSFVIESNFTITRLP